MPATFAAAPPDWADALTLWGARPATAAAHVAVLGTTDRAVPDVEMVVVLGRPRRRLRRALVASGHRLHTMRIRRVDDGVEVTPVRAAAPWHDAVVFALRGDARPASVVAAHQGTWRSATFSLDPRRRAALHVESAVVKVGRSPTIEQRGAIEQSVLRALRDAGVEHVPDALGAGSIGPVEWSAESRAVGSPLTSTLIRDADLVAVSAWLDDVAVATRRVTSWTVGGVDDALRLRGAHRRALELVDTLVDVPSVLVHGDLATGGNVLVDRADFTVIDWETARPSLPLIDLVPFVCLALARRRRFRTVEDEAGYILELCRGRTAESALVVRLVRAHLTTVGLPQAAAGPLAALAWAYQASMRLVYQELVRAAGEEPADWRTAADIVAPAWLDDPDLGRGWPALHDQVA